MLGTLILNFNTTLASLEKQLEIRNLRLKLTIFLLIDNLLVALNFFCVNCFHKASGRLLIKDIFDRGEWTIALVVAYLVILVIGVFRNSIMVLVDVYHTEMKSVAKRVDHELGSCRPIG